VTAAPEPKPAPKPDPIRAGGWVLVDGVWKPAIDFADNTITK
jgi:hypothetical protein